MNEQIQVFEHDGKRWPIRFEEDSCWSDQRQLADLFESTQPAVAQHFKSLFATGELDGSTHKKILSVRTEGNRTVSREIEHYNLDAAIALGFKVGSPRGVAFRVWARARVKEAMLRRAGVASQRLLEDIASLREEIRVLRESNGSVLSPCSVAQIKGMLTRIGHAKAEKLYGPFASKRQETPTFRRVYTALENELRTNLDWPRGRNGTWALLPPVLFTRALRWLLTEEQDVAKMPRPTGVVFNAELAFGRFVVATQPETVQ